MQQQGAVKHVVEAIVLNVKRGAHYCRRSRGKTLLVSVPLILLECLSIVVLGICELWGKWFNREGINIIAGDFASMSGTNELGAPLRFKGFAPDSEHNKLKKGDAIFMSAARSAAFAGDFRGVADLAHERLGEVLAVEEQTQSLYPMHRHILESLGLAAANSVAYLEQSHGRTVLLSKVFLTVQVYAIRTSAYFDRAAQKCHRLDIGILENDLPEIPFLEAYASLVGGAGGSLLGAE